MIASAYRLLTTFQALFSGTVYKHRASTNGDKVAVELFEDLYVRAKQRSITSKYVIRVDSGERLVNTKNQSFGIRARRGDGVLGEAMHGVSPLILPQFHCERGPTVATEIGIEVKILAKAMIKQIDRVIGDLNKQADEFKAHTQSRPPLTVAVVAVNHAEICCGWEGARATVTDGKTHKHPIQEADEAKRRLIAHVKPLYNHFLLLEYAATNIKPFPFQWLNNATTAANYNAELTRMAVEYEARF